MNHLKLILSSLILSFLGITVHAQNGFTVRYSFDADLSATVSAPEVMTAENAVFGGSKLSGGVVGNDQGVGVWSAQVVNNNATNYSNTFIRFDIKPKAGYRLVITQITARQRTIGAVKNNLFRVGCSQNGAKFANSNWEFSSPNIPFSTTEYADYSFVPGASKSGVSSPEYLSAWLTARDENYSSFAWLIDDVEIKGIYVPDDEKGAIVVSDVPNQKIDVMGGDMERSGNFIQNASNTSDILQWCIADTKFNFFRVKYDKKQEMTEGVKDFAFYNKQVQTMQQIRSLNPDIKFLATMKSDYNGYNEGDGNNFPTWIYNMDTKVFNAEKYGIFLADYVEFMFNQGVQINYITTAKEYVQVMSHTHSHTTVLMMNAVLKSRGVPIPEILAPATWGVSQGISYVNNVKSDGYEDEYYAFSSHNLNNQSGKWHDFVLACNGLNKGAYNDESSAGAGTRTSGAEPDINVLLNGYKEKYEMYRQGVQGEMFFEIWSRGVNSETRAIYFRNGQAGKRMRGYYAMKTFVNHVLNKHFVVSNAFDLSDVYCFSFQDDDEYAVWMVNTGSSDYTNIKLTALDAGAVTKQMEWTADGNIGGNTTDITKIENQFSTSIKGKSLNCFIIPREKVNNIVKTKERLNYKAFVQSGHILVETQQSVDLCIFNMSGQKMAEITNESTFMSPPMKKGIYLVSASRGGVTENRKVVVY